MDVDKLNPEERNKLLKLLKEKADEDDGSDTEKKRMQWMCQDEATTREDYLLGKRIKNLDDMALLDDVSRRYYNADVGEDILERTAKQDMMAKMHEDPLYLIKNQEDERKRKLLQNTVRLKKLQALVKKQSESKKKKKSKKSKKKEKRKRKKSSSSSSSSSSDDSLLNTYLKLLSSKEPSKRGDGDAESHERKGSPRPEDRRRLHRSPDGDYNDRRRRDRIERDARDTRPYHDRRRRSEEGSPRRYRSPPRRDNDRRWNRSTERNHHDDHGHGRSQDREGRRPERRYRSRSNERPQTSIRDRRRSRSPPPRRREDRSPHPRDQGRSSRRKDPEEMARLRQEMMENAKNRDDERKHRLESHIQELETEKEKEKKTERADFISSAMMKHASRSSVEDEVKRRAFKRQKMDGAAIHEQAAFARR